MLHWMASLIGMIAVGLIVWRLLQKQDSQKP
jgi:hypothetical protein